MGRSIKIKYTSSTPVKKEVKEIKITYDHIYKVKSNPKIINEFKKNMEIPSELWNGPCVFYTNTHL